MSLSPRLNYELRAEKNSSSRGSETFSIPLASHEEHFFPIQIRFNTLTQLLRLIKSVYSPPNSNRWRFFYVFLFFPLLFFTDDFFFAYTFENIFTRLFTVNYWCTFIKFRVRESRRRRQKGYVKTTRIDSRRKKDKNVAFYVKHKSLPADEWKWNVLLLFCSAE